LRGIKDSFQNYKAFPQQRPCAIPNTTANLCESDASLRRSYLALKARETTFDQQNTVLLKLERFYVHAISMVMVVDSSFFKQICTISTKDSLVGDMKQRANNDKFKIIDDLLYFKN